MSSVQAWRWRLTELGPPLTRALNIGAAARGAVLRQLRKRGIELFPDDFYDSDGHNHAYWLSEDDDEDGRIDHVLVFAETGIAPQLIAAMADVQVLDVGGEMLAVAPDCMGARGPGGLFGPATTWTSVTPYVTPKWRTNKAGKERPHFAPPAQLQAEIMARHDGQGNRLLGDPTSLDWRPIDWLGDEMIPANAFDFVRGDGCGGSAVKSHAPPGDAVAAFATLVFPEPVWGPLAFGYGAHFGLGLLRARD